MPEVADFKIVRSNKILLSCLSLALQSILQFIDGHFFVSEEYSLTGSGKAELPRGLFGWSEEIS